MSRKGDFSTAHRRHNACESVDAQHSKERDEMHATYAIAGALQNEADRAWLAWLISSPQILEVTKRSALSAIKWLEAHPTKTLHPAIRERFRRVETVLRMLADGKTPDPTKRRPRPALPKKTPLPDWMNDPSLLPKKPPGRAA